ncbi:homoserine kinase [Gallaecimonas sp. GXIMD4217]|uniref:homoserine kinase n=1 Tax=Gallaecimonas sp. GXIMD4217 TaxID=3131927 RepID=UPI00311B3F2D
MSVCIYAPASSANLSVGFDLLGLALKPLDGSLLGDWVQAEFSATPSLACCGPFAKDLPGDNIVDRARERFGAALAARGMAARPAALCLYKGLPVGSGLGSSATSVVAALVALNELHDGPLDDDELLALMGELEASISGARHFDNLAPAFLGGLRLITGGQHSRALPTPDAVWLIAYPGVRLDTREARACLPEALSLEDSLAVARRLAAFVDACHNRDPACFAQMVDIIAEPRRQALIPGCRPAWQAMADCGALATGISGSGPSLYGCFADQASAALAKARLEQQFLVGKDGFVVLCTVDQQGARALGEQACN